MHYSGFHNKVMHPLQSTYFIEGNHAHLNIWDIISLAPR